MPWASSVKVHPGVQRDSEEWTELVMGFVKRHFGMK